MTKPATRERSKLTFLETVYPPMSNQEAIWIERDGDAEQLLRTSDMYMIAGREEAKFINLHIDTATNVASFEFVIGDRFSDPVRIAISELPGVADFRGPFIVEAGEKGFRVWDGPPKQPGSDVLQWFTPEKLLWDRARGMAGIYDLSRYGEAATYDLLYVGIAKKGDSFDRLIKNGHKARQTILGNERQRFPGARVTDEIYLFLFKAEPLTITTFSADHNFQEEDFTESVEQKRVIADAEKAFVSMLKPEYNVMKFSNYPKGADGLHGLGYTRYGYAICEAMAFNTPHGCIRGGRDATTGMITNKADAIFVDGDHVEFVAAEFVSPGA